MQQPKVWILSAESYFFFLPDIIFFLINPKFQDEGVLQNVPICGLSWKTGKPAQTKHTSE